MRIKKLFIIPILCLVLLPVTPALAADVTADDIAAQLMCPCGKCILVLNECDCETQEEMLAIIEQQLAQGQSQQEIMNFLFTQYGEQILSSPEQNPDLMLWTSAFIGILAVGTVIYLTQKKRARGK